MWVSEGFRAVRPASGFVTGVTDAAPQSRTFATIDRYGQAKQPNAQNKHL